MYCTFLLGGRSRSASSSSSSSLAGCFLLLVLWGGDEGTCDGPGSSLVSMAIRTESISSHMKSSVVCSACRLNKTKYLRNKYIPTEPNSIWMIVCWILHPYCFVLALTWFLGCESSDSVARTKLASKTLSVTLRITGLQYNQKHRLETNKTCLNKQTHTTTQMSPA